MTEAKREDQRLRSRGIFLLAILLLWLPTLSFGVGTHDWLGWHAGNSAPASPSSHTEEGGLKESLFKWANFLVLFGGLGYFLRKPLLQFLATRSEEIRKSLEEARAAREKAEQELAVALTQMEQIEEELAALRSEASKEMEADRAQILEAAKREAEQIISSAHDEVSLLVKNAQKELREHSAALVVELAEQQIKSQIRPENQGRLFDQFVTSLQGKTRSNH
jgi:F-type H+-transporting ATPase subunit b